MGKARPRVTVTQGTYFFLSLNSPESLNLWFRRHGREALFQLLCGLFWSDKTKLPPPLPISFSDLPSPPHLFLSINLDFLISKVHAYVLTITEL